MELPVDSWYGALKKRHSRRLYLDRQIAPEILDTIEDACTHFKPFHGVRGVLVRQMNKDIFRGLIGSYVKVKGASTYLAFLGDKDVEGVEERMGYCGEGLVLEATAHGLSTCWIGGLFDPYVAALEIKPLNNEKIFAVIPLGYTAAEYSREERLISTLLRSRQRKSIGKITRRGHSENWPAWAQAGLEAARLAPSAMNRQPWAFSLDKRGVLLSMNNPGGNDHFSKRLDCGITMLHFELAARAHGTGGVWEFLPSPDVARYIPSKT